MVKIRIHYEFSSERPLQEVDLAKVIRYNICVGEQGEIGFVGKGCHIDYILKAWSHERPIFIEKDNPDANCMYDVDTNKTVYSADIKSIDVLEDMVENSTVPQVLSA